MKNIDKELIGFFLADGCLAIIRQRMRTKYKEKRYDFYNYYPKAIVTQRIDGVKVLEAYYKRFGGYIQKNNSIQKIGNSNPVKYWYVATIPKCLEIAKLVLKSKIGSPKIKTAKVIKRFCEWKLKKGGRKCTPKEKLQEYKFWELSHKANSFNGVTK